MVDLAGIHGLLVEQARQYLVRQGASNIVVLDGVHTGRKSPYKKPIPDLIAVMDGKKVAVECGYLTGFEKRWKELKDAGYEIVIHFPYLECFDLSMNNPYRDDIKNNKYAREWRNYT